ncbi:MAG TPA: HAD-IIB family hydrolase [archaeon]|nr:HAD-IIB family hydrolase [archaeon]
MPIKILATDLDGTLFSRNQMPENPRCLRRLFAALKANKTRLVYVTGRHLNIVKKAIKENSLARPHAIICSVGTEIYTWHGNWSRNRKYEKIMNSSNSAYDGKKIRQALSQISGLEIQEGEKQSKLKTSYYIPDTSQSAGILSQAKRALKAENAGTRIIYSTQDGTGTGLLDIIPHRASKKAALEFLRKKIGADKSEVLVCGDSGNDVHMILGGYRAVVVGNCTQELLCAISGAEGVYLAKANVACGLLEGYIEIGGK